MTVPSERVSEAISIDAVVETSMVASTPTLFAKSLAEPTLDGNNKMSAVETSISSDLRVAGMARGGRNHHSVGGETDSHSHQRVYEGLNALAYISRDGFPGASLSQALEGD